MKTSAFRDVLITFEETNLLVYIQVHFNIIIFRGTKGGTLGILARI